MRFIPIILFILTFQSHASKNQDQSQYEVEEVVVYGVRSGPELWKVTHGENVLWVLATLSPLPKNLTWHSELVEAVIEDSQAFLLPTRVSADVGFFKGLSLATSAIGIKKNPDKQKLKEVLPEKIYTRWLVLKHKYLGKDSSIEKMRPIFASQKLFDKAIKKIGLKGETGIEKKIRKIAKKNKLVFIKPTITIDLKKPKKAIKKFKKTQVNDLQCFTMTLDRLESDLTTMRLRANAWAKGDVSTIKELSFPSQYKACSSALLNNEIALDMGMENLPTQARDLWIEEAKKALNKNKSTFSHLSISNLLGDESYLKILASEGYQVEVPK